MNQKKAKIIRKLTKETFASKSKKEIRKRYRKVKKAYNETPRNRREFFIKIIMEASKLSEESRGKL